MTMCQPAVMELRMREIMDEMVQKKWCKNSTYLFFIIIEKFNVMLYIIVRCEVLIEALWIFLSLIIQINAIA